MTDRGKQMGGVVIVEAGDGVSEADGDASCQAGGQEKDAPFAAGLDQDNTARLLTAIQRAAGWRSGDNGYR